MAKILNDSKQLGEKWHSNLPDLPVSSSPALNLQNFIQGLGSDWGFKKLSLRSLGVQEATLHLGFWVFTIFLCYLISFYFFIFLFFFFKLKRTEREQ